MKPKTQKATGLIGKCLLAGALIFGLGCEITPQRKSSLNELIRVTRYGYSEMRRNEAIKESGSVVYVGNGEADWNDFIEAKNGYKSRCKILWENDKFICYKDQEGKKSGPKEDYKKWVYDLY